MKTKAAYFFALFIFTTSLFSAPARADVAVTFYSHDFGKNFPHAFFVLKGSLDDGTAVDTSYGFTAVNVSPGILLGSVNGEVQTPKDKYIASSNPHFTVTVNDQGYGRVMAVVRKWQNLEQKSYNLNRRNCVHFASEAIAALGYKFRADTDNWKKPKSFMLEVMALNPSLKP